MKKDFVIFFKDSQMKVFEMPKLFENCRRWKDNDGRCAEYCYFKSAAIRDCQSEALEIARLAALPVAKESEEKVRKIIWKEMEKYTDPCIDLSKEYQIEAEMIDDYECRFGFKYCGKDCEGKCKKVLVIG